MDLYKAHHVFMKRCLLPEQGDRLSRFARLYPSPHSLCTSNSKYYLKNFKSACKVVIGWGGHPGMKRSTGIMESNPLETSLLP